MSDTNGNLTYDMKHSEWLPEPQLKLDVELLPCPFCGAMPYVEREDDCLIIYCGCKVTVGVHGIAAEAVAAWNTRYYPPEVVAALQFYYKDDLNSVEEGILESVDKRPAERALRAIGLLPTKEVKK